MDYVNGEDRILFIKTEGVYLPIGCLTSNTLDESTEMLDTTTRDNKGWASGTPALQSYIIGFSGIQVNSTLVGGNFNVASYDKLTTIKRLKIKVEWKIQGTKFPVVDYGMGYISDIGEASNVGEFMSFTGSITGFGPPLKTSLGTVLLNNGDPNVVIQTDDTGLELLRVSKF
jgi:hypothetical protein